MVEVGQKYGKLTVLRKLDSNKYRYGALLTSHTRWACLCDCGNEHEVSGTHLLSNVVVRCKRCRYEALSRKTRKRTNFWQTHLDRTIKGAIDRGYTADLSLEDFTEMSKQVCHYCGTPPKKPNLRRTKIVDASEEAVNGIDRINNDEGYNKSNCVPCCKICNYMKRTLSYEEFLKHVQAIYEYRARGH